jgi:hypothetical protein
VLFIDNSEKDKNKTPLKSRHSSMLQQKQTNTNNIPKDSHSTDPFVVCVRSVYLIDQFLFVNFSNTEVISLFKNINFSLGHKDDIKLIVVNKFRSLLKSRFKKINTDIQDKHKHFDIRIDNALIDISNEILCISLKE